MSFRKRGEIVNGGGATGSPGAGAGAGAGTIGGPRGMPTRVPQVPLPTNRQSSFSTIGRPIPSLSSVSSSNSAIRTSGPTQQHRVASVKLRDAVEDDLSIRIMHNPGVRPSLSNSQPTVLTGSSDLDKILLHQGLPIGNSILVEESGTTDFATVLLRAFASQGIMHNRIEPNTLHSHVIVFGMSPYWSNDLPGLYKGSSREQKKARIAENESKLSVSNIAHSSNVARDELKMKIAWRYGLNKKAEELGKNKDDATNTAYEHYNNQFDITQKLVPGPSPQEISYVAMSSSATAIITQIESIIKTQLRSNPLKVIRLVIPGLLNPSLYPPTFSGPTVIFPFVHSLRSLLRRYENNLVVIASLPLDLFPRSSSLTGIFETLFDAVIHLQPFNQEMTQLIEKAYKNEPAKIQQGLVNIIKLPILSEKGLMMVHDGEYAFKNGKKKFEIEVWGIPVEDDSKEDEKSKVTPEGGQTTKSIDF